MGSMDEPEKVIWKGMNGEVLRWAGPTIYMCGSKRSETEANCRIHSVRFMLNFLL